MARKAPSTTLLKRSGLCATLWDETFPYLDALLAKMNASSAGTWERAPGKARAIRCVACKQCVVKYTDHRGFRLLGFRKREREECASHRSGCPMHMSFTDLIFKAQATSHIPASLFEERFQSLGGLIQRLDDVTGGLWMVTDNRLKNTIQCSCCLKCTVEYSSIGGIDVHIRNHYVVPFHPLVRRCLAVIADNLSLWYCGEDAFVLVTRVLDYTGHGVPTCEIDRISVPERYYTDVNGGITRVGGELFVGLRQHNYGTTGLIILDEKALFALSLDTYEWRKVAQPPQGELPGSYRTWTLDDEVHFLYNSSWQYENTRKRENNVTRLSRGMKPWKCNTLTHMVYSPETDKWREVLVPKDLDIFCNTVCVIHGCVYVFGTYHIEAVYSVAQGWREVVTSTASIGQLAFSCVPVGRYAVSQRAMRDEDSHCTSRCCAYDTVSGEVEVWVAAPPAGPRVCGRVGECAFGYSAFPTKISSDSFRAEFNPPSDMCL
ncbi:hypothetical protein KIPB_005470 [Kipferlia bialata]|uniref:Uncharacterized protein n=1 Tax=Kipferlia bialata TaxID=797122 RepID=A0A9K3GI82_9EUKA|nr:hypothetical protein KIPB_005470 [Kipferlia bialata]|eukprot:g5470.t1